MRIGQLLTSRTAGAALALLATVGTMELTRPRRTVIYELDARLGWYMLPDQHNWDTYLQTPESTNAFGFRGDDWSEQRVPGVKRVCVLGSSMSEGSSIAFDKIYSTLLEKKLRERGLQVEVFNCAVQGYTLEQSMLNYETKVRALKPDVIVQAFADQDIYETDSLGLPPRGDLRPWLTRTDFYRWYQYVAKPWLHGAGLSTGSPVPGWAKGQKQDPAVRNDLLRRSPFAPELQPLWMRARERLEAYWREVHADGAVFTVVVLPQRRQVLLPDYVGPEKVVKEVLAGKEGAVYLDVVPALRQAAAPMVQAISLLPPGAQRDARLNASSSRQPSELYHMDVGGHFNERGMEVIAEALAPQLEQLLKNIAPPPPR